MSGFDVRYARLPRVRGVTPEAAFAAVAVPLVAAAPGDLVHAFHYADAWAALRVRRRRPVVLKLTGTVEADRMAKVRFDRRLFREAVDGADAVWANSAYAVEAMAWTGRPMDVVPAGVDLERFRPSAERSSRPVVLCTSAPADPRKRLVDVLAAWPAVRAALPDAVLRVAGVVPAGFDVPEGVELVGPLDDDALVEAYSSAAVTVAPAVGEALGLTTLESLACGTPVAGARSGATADLVRPGTGLLYDPGDVDGCAEAIVRAAAIDDRAACRAAAEPWGWDAVADDVEARYRDLLGVRRTMTA